MSEEEPPSDFVRIGQPTKCNDDVISEVARVLRAGNIIKTACMYVGITTRSYQNWMRWGEEEFNRRADEQEPDWQKEPYVRFFRACSQARAHAQMESVARMRQMARGHVTYRDPDGGQTRERVEPRLMFESDRFFLERSFPEDWGPRRARPVETNGDELDGMVFEVEVMSPGVLEGDRIEELGGSCDNIEDAVLVEE